MPLLPNFSAEYSLVNPSVIELTDTSTGTDVTLTDRIVYFQILDDSYIVEEGTTVTFENWPIASSSYEFDLLTRDYAILITVKWLSGSTITYTKPLLFNINPYIRIFRYTLFKAQASNPNLITRNNFFNTYMAVTTFIVGGTDAVELGDDITLAQLADNQAKGIIDNPQIAYS